MDRFDPEVASRAALRLGIAPKKAYGQSTYLDALLGVDGDTTIGSTAALFSSETRPSFVVCLGWLGQPISGAYRRPDNSGRHDDGSSDQPSPSKARKVE